MTKKATDRGARALVKEIIRLTGHFWSPHEDEMIAVALRFLRRTKGSRK